MYAAGSDTSTSSATAPTVTAKEFRTYTEKDAWVQAVE
jgi:hypothetical protein